MGEKIIIGELEKLVFPEHYPYFESHFNLETNLLLKEGLSENSFLNIKFKIKIVNYSLSVKDEDSRILGYSIFEKHIDAYFDWRKEYDWYELKSILFYFLVFSQVTTAESIFKLFKSHKLLPMFTKYLPDKKLG